MKKVKWSRYCLNEAVRPEKDLKWHLELIAQRLPDINWRGPRVN